MNTIESKTKLFYIWQNMKQRCSNKKNKTYQYYGKKGITVCKEWLNNFKVFKKWALENGYSEGLSIDRIDNDGNYEPSNCQWLTLAENTSKARKIKKTKVHTRPGRMKVSIDDATEICVIYSTGKFSMKEIAEGFNIKKTSVQSIIMNQRKNGADIPIFNGSRFKRKIS